MNLPPLANSQGWVPISKRLCLLHHKIGVPEQTLGWFTLGLGLVVEDEPSELSCRQYIITVSLSW